MNILKDKGGKLRRRGSTFLKQNTINVASINNIRRLGSTFIREKTSKLMGIVRGTEIRDPGAQPDELFSLISPGLVEDISSQTLKASTPLELYKIVKDYQRDLVGMKLPPSQLPDLDQVMKDAAREFIEVDGVVFNGSDPCLLKALRNSLTKIMKSDDEKDVVKFQNFVMRFAARTLSGGDSYFVVEKLFGRKDLHIVPVNNSNASPTSIEIQIQNNQVVITSVNTYSLTTMEEDDGGVTLNEWMLLTATIFQVVTEDKCGQVMGKSRLIALTVPRKAKQIVNRGHELQSDVMIKCFVCGERIHIDTIDTHSKTCKLGQEKESKDITPTLTNSGKKPPPVPRPPSKLALDLLRLRIGVATVDGEAKELKNPLKPPEIKPKVVSIRKKNNIEKQNRAEIKNNIEKQNCAEVSVIKDDAENSCTGSSLSDDTFGDFVTCKDKLSKIEKLVDKI